jgi:mono/diheme cytochrome c family protein
MMTGISPEQDSQKGQWRVNRGRALPPLRLTDGKATLAGIALLALTTVYAYAAPALYTAQQLKNGRAVFARNCESCHGITLQGGVGPTLIGQEFAPASASSTIGAVFSFMSSQMPEGSGGSLTQTEYEDVMAYILGENGYPAGTILLDFTIALTSKTPLVSQVK